VRVVFVSNAIRDVEAACAWYEAGARGLGARFEAELSGCLERICEFPRAALGRGLRTRRIPMTRFPYVILYLVEPDRIVVLGVIHLSRHPGIEADRVQDRAVVSIDRIGGVPVVV